MIRDLDLVNLCAAIYNGTGAWDHLDVGNDDGIYWALKKLDGLDAVVFRGSITAHDWVEDFRAFPILTRVGTVHSGFYDGMERMRAELSAMVTQPVAVTGHSLGAARADVLCALMVADHKPPAHRAVFGEPRPGFLDFAQFVKAVPGNGYRNRDASGHDLVTDVPLTLFGKFDFAHPSILVDVSASPAVEDWANPFRYHHVELYQAAVAAAEKEPALC